MVKCPVCGSTFVYPIDHETFVWLTEISLYITYKCCCDTKFCNKIRINRTDEVETIHSIIQKEG